MRRPERHRAIGLSLALASLAAFVAVLVNRDGRESDSLLMIIAIIGVIPSIIYTSFSHIQARRYGKMKKGEGVIGRWNVSAGLWKEFNVAMGRPAPDRSGEVEVIISESTTIVDGDVHYYPVTGDQKVIDVRYIEVPAPYLAFSVETTIRHSPTVGHYCVPVGEGAGEAALVVVENYMARIADVRRRAAG